MVFIRSNIREIRGIVTCGLVVLSCFQIHFTEDYVNGNEAQRREHTLRLSPVSRTDVTRSNTIVRNAITRISLQIRSQSCYDTIDVEFWIIVIINLRNRNQWFGKEWHFTVDTCQLQIRPCTESLHCCIFIENHIGTTRTQRSIAMGNVIITIVDDTIEYVSTIILIGSSGGEISQLAQIVIRIISGVHQVALHLTLENILIGQLLHSLHNAKAIEHGVGLAIEFFIEKLTRTIGFKHVGTA